MMAKPGSVLILTLWLAAALAQVTSPACAQPERFLLYKVERIGSQQAPVIDGKLDEPVWDGKAALGNMRNFLGPLQGEFASQQSDFTILTDGVSLFIGVTFHDDDMASVLCDPAKDPFWNDCTELYFDPAHDGNQSIQLVVDCGGQRFWHKTFNKGYGWLPDSAWYMLADWESAVKRGEDGWTVELRLGAKSFGVDPSPGKVCGFNPCRFRLGSENQEFSAWGFGGMQRQKNMATWGHLLFGAQGEAMAGAGVTRDDVVTVYPELAGRQVAVPVEGGFIVFTGDGEEAHTFVELLAGDVEAIQAQLGKTREAVGRLPVGDGRTGKLAAALPELQRQAEDLIAQATAETMSLGRYDRLGDALTKTRDALHEMQWQAMLISLSLPAGEERAAE